MKKENPHGLREKSLQELCEWIGGINETTSGGRANNFLGQFELKRRLENPNAIRSWIAIVISSIALLAVLVDLGIKIAEHNKRRVTISEGESVEQTTGYIR